MSAALAFSCVIEATAVADDPLPTARPKPLDGLAFYRKDTLRLLQRYLHTSMAIGREPSVLGRKTLRGRATSHRLRCFEDGVILVLDVEKCLRQLDRPSLSVVAHVALEDYSLPEAATLMRESERNVTRIYNEALDRLTRLFLAFELLQPAVENLSRGEDEKPK